MDNVIETTKKLIDTIDSSDETQKLEYYKKKVTMNKELMELINKYKNISDNYEKMYLKDKIYKYEDYKLYMKYYNELFFTILKINEIYRYFTKNGMGCQN